MANESKIRFRLTSDFDGKGFSQANQALGDTAKQSAKATDGIQQFATAASALPGAVGQAAGKVSGFASVLKNLWTSVSKIPGPLKIVALAVASLGAGIKLGMDRAAKRAEEAKERIERAAEAMKIAIASRLNWLRGKMDENLASMRDSVKATISSFDKLIGRVNKVNSAKAVVQVAENESRTVQRSNQRASQLAGITDENERALLEARLNEQEALEEREEIIRQNAANEKEADRNLKNAQDRLKVLESAREKAQSAVIKADALRADAIRAATKDIKTFDGKTKDIKPFDDKLKEAQKELADIEEQLKDQYVEIKVAEENRKATIIKNENALLENETKIIDLNASTQRLIAAQEKNASEQEKAAKIQSLKRQKDDLQAQAKKRENDNNDKIAKARANIKDIEKAQDRTRKGMAKDKEVHQGIGGAGFKYETDANGNPADLAGWERAQRYAARADRDSQRANRAAAANEREYNNLRNKLENGKPLTDSEMKRYDKLDKWNRERKGKKKEEDNIQNLENDNKKILEDTKTAVESIEQKIDQLTTK